jgi:hypothetical protein
METLLANLPAIDRCSLRVGNQRRHPIDSGLSFMNYTEAFFRATINGNELL